MSLKAMASPAARVPGPLVTLVRWRTVAKVLSMVIWSPRMRVLHVEHEGLRAGICLVDVVICRCPLRGSSGGTMLVQRVLSPVSSLESWTVLGDDDLPVAPVERYLAYLTD